MAIMPGDTKKGVLFLGTVLAIVGLANQLANAFDGFRNR